MAQEIPRHNYIYSCDFNESVIIKVGSLEAYHILHENEFKIDPEHCLADDDFSVSAYVSAGNRKLCSATRTAYKASTNRVNWQEWLTLPISYSHLPKHSEIVLQIYGMNKNGNRILCGETTTLVFDSYGCAKKGMEDLKVIPVTSTLDNQSHIELNDNITALKQSMKDHGDGLIEKIDWLDRLTFTRIESITNEHKKESRLMYLNVQYPRVVYDQIPFDIIFFEINGDETHTVNTRVKNFTVSDSTLNQTNVVEQKHHILARTLRTGLDKDLKPDLETRNRLTTIASYPCTKLITSGEQDLLWKFREFLASQKLALSKFLQCVSWEADRECNEAIEIMKKYEPISLDEALELLSPVYSEKKVRQFAVRRLMHADDEEIILYLLQLVQAIRYESLEVVKSGMIDSPMTLGMMSQADLDDALAEEIPEPDEQTSDENIDGSELDDVELFKNSQTNQSVDMDMASFLIHRASSNFTLANYIFWFLKVESEETGQDKRSNQIFSVMFERLKQHLKKHNANYYNKIVTQQRFMEKLQTLIHEVQITRSDRKKKIERLKALLTNSESITKDFTFSNFEPVHLPLDPDKLIKAILPDDAYLFKSALCPARLTLLTTSGEHYSVLFKNGDDLRQDQLILQMIHLMDRLLRKENLDLKLTPYKVLATGGKHGFIQHIVNAPALASIQDSDGTILNYLRKHAPGDTQHGVAKHVMDTYIRSCAGYCVITYILGVGDRHLDNLLLTEDGRLFHIDFGYILGRDPKPMPPPIRLTKEMVDAMGGIGSEHYKTFTDLYFSAFFHLRRSANLILNLFTLMVDANIPDIMLEPDKTVNKIQEKFLLNMSEEEAAKEMHNLLEACVSALMPAITERLHRIAQGWRK